jgi:hypothetical protein
MNENQETAGADWVARSDAFARRYVAVMRRFEPEVLSWFGDAESDAATSELAGDGKRREAAAYGELAAELEESFEREADPRVRTDLGVLRERCERTGRTREAIYGRRARLGVEPHRSWTDEKTAPSRHHARSRAGEATRHHAAYRASSAGEARHPARTLSSAQVDSRGR